MPLARALMDPLARAREASLWRPGSERCHSSEHSLVVARGSGCGSDVWIDTLAAKPGFYGQPRRQLTYFNVGANKGFNIAILLQRLAGANFTSQQWASAMTPYFREKKITHRHHQQNLCGLCRVCTRAVRRIADDVQLDVHAFEMTQQNSDWLEWAFKRFAVNATLVHAVVSNVSGVVAAPAVVRTGEEALSASLTHRRGWVPIRAIALDDYVAEAGLSSVDIVSIDAEGFDALVLEGMRASLTAHIVNVFEFEYHRSSYWSANHPESRSLKTTLSWLTELGYGCFWTGADGCLAPASGLCWRDEFEFRIWSNLVCAHGWHLMQLRAEASKCWA